MCITDVMLHNTVEEGAVRLVGGATPLEGRVEIFLFGQWGTVCNNTWGLTEATVVCHQLGYLRAVAVPGTATFGAGSGPTWYRYVSCEGNEMSLTECNTFFRLSGYAYDCYHNRDAGVVCSGES